MLIKEGLPRCLEMPLTSLLADVSQRCLQSATEQLDSAIDECQRRVCEHLAIDHSELWQADGGADESLALTHLHRRANEPADSVELARAGVRLLDRNSAAADISLRTDANAFFPWTFARARRGEVVAISSLDQLPSEAARDKEMFLREGIRAVVILPLLVNEHWVGLISFGMTTDDRKWTDPEFKTLRLAADIFANALGRVRTTRSFGEMEGRVSAAEEELRRSGIEVRELKERLKSESDYQRGDIKVNQKHTAIVGQSRAIRKVLQQVEQVAPVSCPVLITGESGTGKELIAQSIHRLSPRGHRGLVTVNCAALPAGLVESELFGRERGAFTGALSSQAGRFELADQSTIFLDEVAELPLELQGKLLRVLQEGEYARLGNPKTRKVDVRVLAATNRDLGEEVRKQRFREDLFYRLSVFPIDLPPLRERAEDIPLLVFEFLEELSARMGKRVTKVPRRVMESLERHYWPGNIRELRNVIERGVIISTGDTLRIAFPTTPQPGHPATTLAEVERQHILATLEKTDWHIKGPNGAAKILDMKPGTLYSRMRKLGVPHRRQKDGMAT